MSIASSVKIFCIFVYWNDKIFAKKCLLNEFIHKASTLKYCFRRIYYYYQKLNQNAHGTSMQTRKQYSKKTLLVLLIEMMWRLWCFCIVLVLNTGGVLVGNLLEITSPSMPFGNFVIPILCTFINNLFSGLQYIECF